MKSNSIVYSSEDFVIKTEILEALHIMAQNHSFASSNNDNERFRLMFPGSYSEELSAKGNKGEILSSVWDCTIQEEWHKWNLCSIILFHVWREYVFSNKKTIWWLFSGQKITQLKVLTVDLYLWDVVLLKILLNILSNLEDKWNEIHRAYRSWIWMVQTLINHLKKINWSYWGWFFKAGFMSSLHSLQRL